MSKLVIGCGYLGMRVATRWRVAGEHVLAITRNRDRASEFARCGLTPIVADVTQPATLSALPTCATVLYAVGFDRTAGHSMARVYVDGLQAVLDALPAGTGRVIYVSSTGVYGQSSGEWVEENSVCRPIREGGRVCLAAESALAAHALASRAIVLRLAGIYGPGRIPRLAELRARQPLPAAAHEYLNLIHVDDAVEIILAAESRATTPAMYVVADGHPVRRGEYFAELARLLGMPNEPSRNVAAVAAGRSRTRGNKRICVERVQRDLQVALQYPTFRDGIAASLELADG